MNPLASFTDLADSWWTCVLHSTWQSSLVVLLAFAVVWLRRKRSASFLYAVLVVALLKFLVPPIIEIPVFESPVAFAPAMETTKVAPVPSAATEAAVVVANHSDSQPVSQGVPQSMARVDTDSPIPLNLTLPTPELSVTESESPIQPQPAFNITQHWKTLLALLHVAGIAALGLLMASSYLHLRRLLRAAQPANEELSSLANDVAAQLRLRRPVAVLLTSDPCAPMATGLFKRRILLPEVLTTLDSDEMRAVLAHELAHHRRMDLGFIWIEHLVTLLWWFNPLVWILVRAIHRKREDCCDDIVLSLDLAANGQYCKTLLHAAKRLHRPFTPRLVFGCASKLHPLGQRITRIMDTAIRRRAALTAGGVAVVALMGLVLLPTFLPVAADADPTRTSTDETRTDTDVIAGTGGGPVNVLQFDGENDYVLIPPAKPLDLGETFTVSAWVRVEPGCSDEAPVLRRGDARPGYDPYMFGIYRNRMHLGSFRNTSRDHDTAELVIADVDNDWHYWTGVRDADAGRLYLYRDGELVDEAPTGGPLQYSTESMGNEMGAIDQGAWSGGTNWGFFKGAIDQVSVWNVARKTEGIQREMTQGIKSGEPGLVALWTFDEEVQTINDSSSSGISGTLGSSPEPDANDPARVAADAESTPTVAASPSGPMGVVRGVVTNAATGEPVTGAFVAIDHSGDAGGSNLERFNEEGLYVTAETGADGRFTLEGVALRDGHPFYVTAPGFVRQNDSISLTPQRPELALDVSLRPGATIAVALEQVAGAASAKTLFRLTAKDGRQFLPSRGDWPAWPYRSEPARGDAFEFAELAPGQFKVEAIQFAPESIAYLGAVEAEVAEGETKAVRIGSQPHDTKVTITTTRDPYQSTEQPRTVLTIGPELDLTLPPGYFVHAEDDVLGRILANAIVMHPALGQDLAQDAPAVPTTTTELFCEVTGLPEGNYTAVVHTVGSYPNFKSPSVYPRWMTFELKEHDAISVRIPWIEPKGPYVDQEKIQSQPAAKIEEEIAGHYANADAEVREYIRWTASQFGNSGLWFAHDAFAQLTPEEREQKIVYHVEVLSGDYGRQLCRSLAEAGALQDKRLMPGLIKAASYHRDDSDYDCRPKWMAVSALGRQDDISAVPALIPLVDHGNTNTRMWARASLARLTGQNFKDDKQAWGQWWNDSANEPKIDLSELKPWVMPGQTQATAPPSPPASGTPQPAVVPPESMAVVDGLQGVVTFNATYHHRSRGSDIPTPSVFWLKPQVKGGIVAAAYMPAFNETTVARVSLEYVFFRYEVFGHGRGGRPPANRLLDLGKGTVTIKHEGGEKDGEVETIAAPADGLFMPNSRPDSYTAHMALFFANVPDEGDADEVLCYDYGNDGKSMASYTIRLENVGKEEVTVPAGTFTANHVIENHLTFGDTWYKKRPGHITDYWVLDNGIVVRILRHREPYELQLASFTSEDPLPGVIQLNEGVTPVALGAAPTGNASAAVTVVHKNTNAGMPAVNVYVQGGPNGSIQRSGTTNADGHFTFNELPAGDYTVGCGAPKGYIETGSERVSVADGGKAEITLRLDPGIRIAGSVIDLDGNPIAGAKVRARSWDQSGGSFNSDEVETDSGGKYEIAGVPPGGEYRLFGSAEGHYSGYINVQPRGDLDGINFTLGKGATVSGRAIDNEGNVVRDAQISLMPDWNSWQEKQGEMNVMWGGQTPLDDSGNFTFSDVAPGKYNFHLWVRRDDQSFEQTSVGGPFEVEAGAVLSAVEAVFPAAESERIEGAVRDETGAPVPNVSVDAITYEGVHWGAKTDENGHYTLVGLGDHTFDIYFFHDVLPDVVLRKVRPGVYDADAIMPHAGKISGVAINDVTGEPVREGSLSIVWHEAEYGFERGYHSEQQGGSIQQDGTFEIDRVLPGTAYFKVSAPGYLELQSPAVTVKAAQTTEPVEMRLTPAAIVEGTVLANGQPLDVEQGISVMCLDDPIHEVPAGYIIHDGKYRLDRLPAGTYEIGAWARGRGHMADQKERITVKAGDVTELNFVLDFPPPPESRTAP